MSARYLFALAATGIALMVKLQLAKVLTRDEPVLVFFAAVIASAVFGGFGPGLLAACLSAICDEYFFMAPFNRWSLNSLDQVLRLLIFVLEAGSISLICAKLKTALFKESLSRRRAERAVATARKLQQRILEVGDAERRRLGHDMHDGLGQHLTGISLLLRRLQERLAVVAPAEATEAVALGDLARSAVEWTHDLCRTLSPGIEDENSLPDLLKDLATKAENLFRTNCCCEVAGQAWPIEPAVSSHLYRIAQEAITNAARHGKAKHIVLRLEFTDSELVTSVTDDGSGIGPKSASAEGMGLQIMRYRATMIGGSIEIRQQSPGGTSVMCRCPRRALISMEVSSAAR